MEIKRTVLTIQDRKLSKVKEALATILTKQIMCFGN
jgi:hypothetical protein